MRISEELREKIASYYEAKRVRVDELVRDNVYVYGDFPCTDGFRGPWWKFVGPLREVLAEIDWPLGKTIEEESKSLDDLAAEQGVKPVENIKSLENPELAEVMEEPGDGAKGWWKCEHCGRMTRSDALDCGLCPDCKASLRAKGRGW